MGKRSYIQIAHALGVIQGLKYTNSQQALGHSMNAGFKYFEADVDLTKDGKIILFHDYCNIARKELWLDAPVNTKSWDEVRAFQYAGEYTLMMLDDLLDFMKVHKDIYVILDVKRHGSKKVGYLNKLFLKKFKKNKLHISDQDVSICRIAHRIFSMIGWSSSTYEYSEKTVFDYILNRHRADQFLLDRIIPQIHFENRKYFFGLREFPIRIWKCITKIGYEREFIEANRIGCKFVATSDINRMDKILYLSALYRLDVLVYSISDHQKIESLSALGVRGFYIDHLILRA